MQREHLKILPLLKDKKTFFLKAWVLRRADYAIGGRCG